MELPRRLRLGLKLGADPFRAGAGGLVVSSVLPGSFAAGLGLLPGDVVRAVAGIALDSDAALREALRVGARTDEVTVEIARASSVRQVVAPAVRVGEETFDGGEVRYGTVARDGVRLRTIATVPSSAGPHPLVVFLQGISCASVDFAGVAPSPAVRLLRELSARGLATLRLERRGLGDSEGGPCSALDFDTEVGDLRALLAPEALASLGFDCERVVLFGHSVGGMMLPLVADGWSPLAAIAAGSSRRRWSDCVAASTRRQLVLRGEPAAEIERIVQREVAAITTPPPGELLFERAAAFHKQLQNANIGEAYDRLSCPLLVVQGEYDWVVGEDEGRVLVAAARGPAKLSAVPGMDHAFSFHPSLAASLAAFGRGEFSPVLADEIVSFVQSAT